MCVKQDSGNQGDTVTQTDASSARPFSVVKVIRRDHADPASPYRWEPKRSFFAVARHNRTALGH